MDISSTASIENTVKFDSYDKNLSGNFSLVDIYGSMIGNRQYSEGYQKFAAGGDSSDAYIYRAISAIGNDIGDSVYQNIRRYIQLASDVDTCKVVSLRSMLKLFGYDYTIIDNVKSIPDGVLKLIDVLSIKKKYLLRAGVLNPEFLSVLTNELNPAVSYNDELSVNFINTFIDNTFTISTDLPDICTCSNGKVDIRKLGGVYLQDSSESSLYLNNYGYSILRDETEGLFTLSAGNTVFDFQQAGVDFTQLTGCGQSCVVPLSSLSCSNDFAESYPDRSVAVVFGNINVAENTALFDDDRYRDFLVDLYYRYIYAKLAQTYATDFINGNIVESIPVYGDLGSMYFDSEIDEGATSYMTIQDNAILSVKAFNHIPISFDQKAIVDAIENGTDTYDAYSGAQLCVLTMEKNRRAATIKLDDLDLDDTNTPVLPQNRYNYYRKQETADYAKFVDNFYRTDNALSTYSLDKNYGIVQQDTSSKVITLHDELDPAVDIDSDMVQGVAEYLAALTQYICKIRDKIKLQTQKNFMKGTNLLLIYIINEYLNEYADYNRDFFTGEMSSIYNKLHNHQFVTTGDDYTIKVQEFWDGTEYMNIDTPHSKYSISGENQTNERYWELTSSANTDGAMFEDGQQFTLNEIEEFYHKVLNLSVQLGGQVQPFLCALYDLGADESFYADLSGNPDFAPYLSVFSSVLESGDSAYDILKNLIDLSSAYLKFDSYIDHASYIYPKTTIENQITHARDTHIFQNLSDQYLSGVDEVYDANIDSINDLSDQYNDLTAKYNDFITGEYKFYYKKSTSKYSYEDLDFSNEYKHDYFIGNTAYVNDSMTIYNKLVELSIYSEQDNIKNWSVIDRYDYMVENFNSISVDFYDNVFVNICSNVDYIDPQSPALKTELQYAYDYINQKIEETKSSINSEYDNLKTQLEEIYTKYNSIESDFNTALGQAGSNPRGKNLGETLTCERFDAVEDYDDIEWYTYWISPDTERTSVPVPEKGNGYMVQGKKNEGKSAKYKLTYVTINSYNSDDTIPEKVDILLGMMNTYTIHDDTYYYGLKYAPAYAALTNVKTEYNNLETEFNDLTATINSKYGIEPSGTSTDLGQRIKDWRSAFNTYGSSLTDSSSALQTYKNYMDKLNTLINREFPLVENAYSGIFTDTDQVQYMQNYVQAVDITLDELENLNRYCSNKDESNYTEIMSQIDSMLNTDFQNLIAQNNMIRQNFRNSGINIYQVDGVTIENYIAQLYSTLETDRQDRTAAAETAINTLKDEIESAIDDMLSQLEDRLDSTDNFDDCVAERLAELNFFDHEIYQKYQKMYLTYGGNEFCYDPYYNMKNTVHPSYQVHPYLWNFIFKTSFSETLIGDSFSGDSTASLEEDAATAKLSEYLNEYGQPIDLWKKFNDGATDYSGYASRYERSDNQYDTTGDFGETIDYDGGFYPPAANDLLANRKAFETCIACLSDKITLADMVKGVSDILSNDITSYITFDENGYVKYQGVISTITPFVSKYIPQCSAQASLVNYLTSTPRTADMIDRDEVLSALSAGIGKTFYERYYKPLGLHDDEIARIAEQLQEYKDDIVDIISAGGNYDIYKYGIDLYGNSYILYKKYDGDLSAASYQIRRDTPGVLWVRMSGQPIAFPAFGGSNPQYYIYDPAKIHSAIISLANLNDAVEYANKSRTQISKIDDDMKYFYDFEISQDKSFISLVAYNFKFGSSPDSPCVKYENSIVVSGQFKYKTFKYNNLKYLQFFEQASGRTDRIDYIDFCGDQTVPGHQQYNEFCLAGKIMNGVRHPKLVGSFIRGQSSIDFVYVCKKYTRVIDEDGNESFEVAMSNQDVPAVAEDQLPADYDSDPAFFVVEVLNGIGAKCYPSINAVKIDSLSGQVVGDQACTGYDRENDRVCLAFNTECSAFSRDVSSWTAVSSIDFIDNTDGYLYDDPRFDSMNSHDMFDTDVSLVKYDYTSKSLKFAGLEKYNLNADISYLPQYPGMNGESLLYSGYPDKEYYQVELLGRSKNIDDYISRVVPGGGNPYFDYETIMNDFVHGRVYEDYVDDSSSIFTVIRSPAINKNTQIAGTSYAIGVYDEWFELTYNLLKFGNFSEIDYKHLNLLIYNENSTGKNPYYIGSLTALESEDFIDLFYNEADPSDAMEQYRITTDGEGYDGTIFTAGGTYPNTGTTGIDDTNHIDGVLGVQIRYQAGSHSLIIRFRCGENGTQTTYIPENAVKILIYNPKDLNMFKYYHMFDAYGAIKCFASEDAFNDALLEGMRVVNSGTGWTIYKDIPGMAGKTYKSSFYYDEAGNVQWVENIQLSNYSSLDQIEILDGNKKLSFKLGEDKFFGIDDEFYYYPSLNISYPLTPAMYVNSRPYIKNGGDGFGDIFSDKNLFILNPDDINSVLSDIGPVDIPIMYDGVDDLRVYEDFLSTDENGESNFKKYDVSDGRIAQFAHFCTDSGDTVEIPDNAYNMSFSDLADKLYAEHDVLPRTSENTGSIGYTEYVRVYPTPDNCDLQNLSRIYVNYCKRFNEGIDLYFNYNNYLNSPYVKIEDSKLYSDTIDNTYLHLKPGEDGLLDIVVQFKYYIGGKLYGYLNACLLRYHVYNVSDDKPKFVIKKIYYAQNGQFERGSTSSSSTSGSGSSGNQVKISISDIDIQLADFQTTAKPEFDIVVNIYSDGPLMKGSTLWLDYPASVVTPTQESRRNGYGLVKLTVQHSGNTSFRIPFTTIKTVAELETSLKGYTHRYPVEIAEPSIYTNDGEECSAESNTAHISITPRSSASEYGVLGYTADSIENAVAAAANTGIRVE